MPRDALDRIKIQGFKSIASLDLKLRPLNVLIGANGSGKSNLIGVFEFLHAIRLGHLQEYVARAGGAEKILHFGSKVTPEASFELSFHHGKNEYELALASASGDTLVCLRERAAFTYDGNTKWQNVPRSDGGREPGISKAWIHGPYKDYVAKRLEQFRVYHLHDTSDSSPMRKTSNVNDNRALHADCANLAAFLHLLKQKHEKSYGFVRANIQRVAPFFDDFALAPLELNPETIKLEWRHKSSGQVFDASSLSDGTLRFIALATLFLQPARFHPALIVVDEPELGLHPFAVGLLASLMKLAARTTQVIVATQSAQLLDHFEPEDVLVASRERGATKLQRLDSKKLKVWLEEYSLGQLWEKNEFGGMPVVE
ncbi:MAG: AAA family ATPase [Bryobacteraceae bacterium]